MNIWKITETNKIVRTEKKIEEDPTLVKVRVARAALTETDFSAYSGKSDIKYPIVPSKSAVGLISDADNPLGLKVGERVLLSAYSPCYDNNAMQDCSNPTIRGVDEDGFLSDFAYVDKNSIFTIPENVSDLACLFYDYIAVSLSAIEKMKIEKGEYVAIVGGDVQSLILADVVNYYQAIPILITKSDTSIRQASANGIDYVINTRKCNPVEKVFEITGGKMAEHVAYSVYSGESNESIFNLAKLNGSVGILGYNKQNTPITANLNELICRQLSLYSIKEGMKEITSTINMLAMDAINTSIYQTSKVSFASVETIFSGYKTGNNTGLIIVDCNDA